MLIITVNHPKQEPPTETPANTSPNLAKKRVYAQQITQKLVEGKTYTQICREIGFSRPTLYGYLRDGDVQQLLIAELTDLRTGHMQQLTDMLESKNPQDRRFALKERGVMIRHMEDKTLPTLIASKNINLDIKIDTRKRDQHILNETIRRLPPTIGDLVITTLQQVYKEYAQYTQ